MSKDKRVTLTAAQLRREKEESTEKALVLFIAAAMDEFDWTEDDVQRFSVRLERYGKAVMNKVISLEKVCDIIHEIMGIEIRIH